jgi:hypothetical protein
MTLRAVFYEEDDARTVAARLVGDGFAASVLRERLAGEDDDEDHPWAVLTDAPEVVVELLVEAHDGWLDAGGDAGGDAARVDVPPPAPLDLPQQPRRVKGHFRRD